MSNSLVVLQMEGDWVPESIWDTTYSVNWASLVQGLNQGTDHTVCFNSHPAVGSYNSFDKFANSLNLVLGL